ncbi:MAG: hypothetical protein M1831_002591 [Alyxoria varia]|nr:MAG: hypothetical protein M1831_002591 [Alyxoria varia]
MGKLNDNKLQELLAAHKKGIVVGLKGVSDVPVVPRRDIDVLLKDQPQTFNLFIIALYELQQNKAIDDKYVNLKDSTDDPRMTYFQIAGIHGAPKTQWDNMGRKQNWHDRSISGYCAHSQVTFPTWHRPYLAMLEQSLFLKMVEIAKRYNPTDRAVYLDKVTEFRLPFWDYYRPRGGPVTFPGVIDEGKTSFPYDYRLPKIFTEKNLFARLYPDNTLKPLPRNPFQYYKFVDEDSRQIEWKKFANFPPDKTTRYYTGYREDVDTMNNLLNEFRMDSNRFALTMLGDAIYNPFEAFSYNGSDRRKPFQTQKEQMLKANGNLESLHGLYHGLVGGFFDGVVGHMTAVPVAAFDPVFWAHHGQVERIFALWQATHKGKQGEWFSDPTEAEKPLLPFRIQNQANDKTRCWKSNESKSTDDFGYTYDEVKAGGNVLDTIRKLYEWSVPLANAGKWGEIPAELKKALDLKGSEFFEKPKQPSGGTSARVASDPPAALQKLEAFVQPQQQGGFAPAQEQQGDFAQSGFVPPQQQVLSHTAEEDFSREWYIDDKVERLALNGAFSIFYFVKDNNDPPGEKWLQDPSLAGITHIFAAPVEHCDNCGVQDEQSHVVTNTVPITSLLLDYVTIGQLESLRPEHVKPFLTRGLKWRVISPQTGTRDPRQLAANKNFRVNVSCKVARLPRDSGDVTYEKYPEIVQDILAQASASPTA